jgi:hypothetical protein
MRCETLARQTIADRIKFNLPIRLLRVGRIGTMVNGRDDARGVSDARADAVVVSGRPAF